MSKFRTVETYKDYTTDFLDSQTLKVVNKFIWTFQLIEEIEIVPTTYLKHIEDGIYDVRVKSASNIYRIMAFFDDNKLVLTINGFQKKTQKTPKSEILRAKKLDKNMKKKNPNTKSLDSLKVRYYGKEGSAARKESDKGYEEFKLGFMVREARIKSGLTQQELADKVGTSKSYISKIENNIKEVRISTLKKIVELGLGGHLELKFNLN